VATIGGAGALPEQQHHAVRKRAKIVVTINRHRRVKTDGAENLPCVSRKIQPFVVPTFYRMLARGVARNLVRGR